jgi:outer membrane lipoprotein-sorting protein
MIYKIFYRKVFVIAQVITLVFMATSFVEAAELDGAEIIERSNKAYYYSGKDGRASLKMTITDRAGRVRTREMTLLRLDITEGGAQRYYVYFRRPADIAGMVFMVWKNIDKDDDRWLYIPAIDLVKRVAAKDKRSSFAGSHFTYEDVSGRTTTEDTHELVRDGEVNGRSAYVIKNTPKDAASVEFAYYLSWIDKVTYLPVKGEYFNKAGKSYRVITIEETKDIQGIATVTKAKVEETGRGTTIVEFSDVKYDIGLSKKTFTERSLRRPPRRWIK